jgi:hypothetical protein
VTNVQSRIEGLEESRRALEKIIRAEIGAIPGALKLVGQEWTTRVRRRAPVRTGRLRRSYTWEVGAEGGGAFLEVSTNVEYAPAQEYGTSGQGGTPHLRPATDEMREQIPKLVAEAMGRAGRRAAPPGGG